MGNLPGNSSLVSFLGMHEEKKLGITHGLGRKFLSLADSDMVESHLYSTPLRALQVAALKLCLIAA